MWVIGRSVIRHTEISQDDKEVSLHGQKNDRERAEGACSRGGRRLSGEHGRCDMRSAIADLLNGVTKNVNLALTQDGIQKVARVGGYPDCLILAFRDSTDESAYIYRAIEGFVRVDGVGLT